METSITLKVSELDESILQFIRQLFKGVEQITVTISSATDFGLNASETKEEYIARIKHAIRNLDEGKGISYTEKQLGS